ncbi:MAG: ribonuclease P protein component [Burkholderiales bacterium]|nr:ribonuclease P protein component [Burkholderiales bacterium]
MRDPATRRRRRFGRDQRLHTSAAFEALLRRGRRTARHGFVFYTLRRDSGPARLGILLSRRHARKATMRNRIKRCIREAFRLEQARLGALDVLVRPPCGMKPGPATLALLRSLFGALAR